MLVTCSYVLWAFTKSSYQSKPHLKSHPYTWQRRLRRDTKSHKTHYKNQLLKNFLYSKNYWSRKLQDGTQHAHVRPSMAVCPSVYSLSTPRCLRLSSLFSLPETAWKKRILHEILSIGVGHRRWASNGGGSAREISFRECFEKSYCKSVITCSFCGFRWVQGKKYVQKLEGNSSLGRSTDIHQVLLSRNTNFDMQGECVP